MLHSSALMIIERLTADLEYHQEALRRRVAEVMRLELLNQELSAEVRRLSRKQHPDKKLKSQVRKMQKGLEEKNRTLRALYYLRESYSQQRERDAEAGITTHEAELSGFIGDLSAILLDADPYGDRDPRNPRGKKKTVPKETEEHKTLEVPGVGSVDITELWRTIRYNAMENSALCWDPWYTDSDTVAEHESCKPLNLDTDCPSQPWEYHSDRKVQLTGVRVCFPAAGIYYATANPLSLEAPGTFGQPRVLAWDYGKAQNTCENCDDIL